MVFVVKKVQQISNNRKIEFFLIIFRINVSMKLCVWPYIGKHGSSTSRFQGHFTVRNPGM